jgi:integrase
LARVREYYDALKAAGLGDYTLCDRLRTLTAALKAMAPQQDWLWIARAASKIQSRAVPVRDIDGRLQPMEEVAQLGLDLMQAADEGDDKTPMQRAILYRDGLLVALMTHRAPRLSNITHTNVGQQLERRGDDWWLSYAGKEMKGRRPFQCPVPAKLKPALERYLALYRPILLGDAKPTRALWISSKGNPFADGMVAQRITWRTQQRFGRSINPHSFRHLASSLIAEVDPDNVTNAARILGHSSMKTTEKHYIRAKTLEATERHQTVVRRQRKRKAGPK